MKAVASNLRCPACGGPLVPVALACEPCGLRVEGTFVSNEFATLSAQDLHLLRIFVHCEGRLRDMESALGVSYPTVKARLAELRASLRAASPEAPLALPAESAEPERPTTPEKPSAAAEDADVARLLDQIDQGTLSPAQAIAALKSREPSHERKHPKNRRAK